MAVASVNINAVDNMSATLVNLQQQLNNLQQQANNIVINPRAGNGAGNAFTNLNAQARILESTMNRLGNVVWSQFVSALKDAYQEIKNIDDELVVVRRVTGKTSKELEGMTKNAFDVAQKYGVSASDYLHGVAQFTRAGYGEQAEGLAELSVQLQRAGDVTADVANQYMTAVDKAYGMQGSVEALTAAMDGANQIGNEYATTVGEIAAGIGKVASIAATGHVGIDELTAALGTITAVTQRSGTEAATALRAIFLNIMGNTQTEIEEGAKWTAGEIEGLRQVLELYAPDVVAAAEATNTLIDPMEAIGALAKSYQDGILTESKLFTMVSDIGGKLRTNQLMVLIKNWDMYQSMLGTFANASGSISREIANSMDSITVKTEQLKAAWVSLVSDSMSTGLIKDFLDGLIACVNAAGNLQTVLGLVLGVVTALKSQRIGTLFAGMFGGGAGMAANIAGSVRGIGLAMAAVALAVTAVNGVIQAHNAQMEKMKESAGKQSDEAARSSAEITKLYAAYASATAGSKAYETALRALAEALGLTAEQAQSAKDSIAELTAEQLQQAIASAKGAMDRWSSANSGKWAGQSFNIIFGAEGFENEDIAAIVNKYYDAMSKYARDAWKDDYTIGASWTLAANEDAERLVAAYELALEMQKDLDRYGLEHGIEDMSDMPGYDVLSGYISDMESTYDSAKAVVDNYVSAVVNASVVAAMAATDIVKANEDLADGTADAFSTEEIEAYAQALDELAQSFDQTTFMGKRQYTAFMKQIAEMFPNLIKYSKEYSKYISDKNAADGLADGADSATDSVNRLAQALSTAAKAKTEFDKAMENTPKENAGFADYQSAYSAYAAEIEAGRVNSAIAMAAAKYLMAGSGQFNFDEIYAQGGYKGVNAAMKKGPWATVFGDAEEEYGEGFLDLLAKTANKAGQIMDSTGQKVIGTYKETNGHVQFAIEDMLELSKVTGLSLDQIWQSVQALGVYGETGSTSVEGMVDSLAQMGKEAGVTATETGKLSVDYGKLLQFMQETPGKTAQDWDDMKQILDFLNEIGMISLTNVPDVAEGWQNYKDWAADAAESAGEAAESMGEAADSAEQAAEETPDVEGSKESMDAVTQAANGAAEAAKAAYDEYEKLFQQIDALVASRDYTITFDADGNPAIHTIETIETDAGLVTRERTIQFDVNGNVVSILDTITTQANNAAETRTIHYNADGSIAKIEVVRQSANDAAEDRWIYYYTNGQVTGIELTRTNADSTKEHWIYYFTNGQVTGIDKVRETAEGPEQETWTISYSADGTIADIGIVYAKAGEPTGVTRVFHYAADGSIENIEETEKTAEGVTTKRTYEFVFGADGNLLKTKVTEYEVYADGSTSEPYTYILDADDEGALAMLAEAEAAIKESQEGTDTDYSLGAETTGVTEGIEGAEKELKDSTDKPYNYNVGLHFVGASGEEHGSSHGGQIPENPFEDDLVLGPLMGLLGGYGPKVELSFEPDDSSVAETVSEAAVTAQQEADAEPPITLKMVPKRVGETIDPKTEKDLGEGKIIYHAAFEVEDSDAVLDIFTTLDEETGTVHRIKIMTEGDGTQTIEETITDAEGLQKTYTTTIDADGNAITTFESLEELALSLERVYTMTASANTGTASKRLDDLASKAKKLDGKKITITTVVEGDTLPDMEENAKGTDSFRGGLSLINEKGPELIAANGWAKILGHGDPTVANIPKGARIYTAEETARILNGVGGEKFWAFENGYKLEGDVQKPQKPKEDPKEEPKEPGGGGSSGGSSKDDKNEFWDTIKEYLEYGLKKIEYSIKEYEMSVTLLERARDKILKPILDELATLEYTMSMLDYEVKLLERARDDAVKPLDEQIEKLKEARQISKEDEALEEKKLAVEEARANLLDVMHQRTVRYFNEESGQWEWMVDHKAVQQAQEQLDKAEKDYEDAQADYEITLLERQKADIEKTYQEQIDALQAQIDEMDRRKEDLEHEQEKITYEYDQSIKPLQEQMDDLQAVYDDLQYYYDRLVDAVEVPTASLSAALTQMGHAAEQYSSQLQDTVKLLDTLYELAPTFSAIEMGDLGQYAAQQSHMGDYKADDHSQTVYIERMQVFGEKGRMLGDALRNAGIYRN